MKSNFLRGGRGSETLSLKNMIFSFGRFVTDRKGWSIKTNFWLTTQVNDPKRSFKFFSRFLYFLHMK